MLSPVSIVVELVPSLAVLPPAALELESLEQPVKPTAANTAANSVFIDFLGFQTTFIDYAVYRWTAESLMSSNIQPTPLSQNYRAQITASLKSFMFRKAPAVPMSPELCRHLNAFFNVFHGPGYDDHDLGWIERDLDDLHVIAEDFLVYLLACHGDGL